MKLDLPGRDQGTYELHSNHVIDMRPGNFCLSRTRTAGSTCTTMHDFLGPLQSPPAIPFCAPSKNPSGPFNFSRTRTSHMNPRAQPSLDPLLHIFAPALVFRHHLQRHSARIHSIPHVIHLKSFQNHLGASRPQFLRLCLNPLAPRDRAKPAW